MHALEVLTQNMANASGNPEIRYENLTHLVLAEPANRRPDVLQFQEVTEDFGVVALRGLTKELGDDYNFCVESTYDDKPDPRRLVVISNLSNPKSRADDFGVDGKRIQLVDAKAKDTPVTIANLYLETQPHQELARVRRLARLARYLKTEREDTAHLVAGDTNSLPWYLGILMLKHRFGLQSAHQTVHQREPGYTFPALSADELLAGKYLKPGQLAALKKLARVAYALSNQQRPEIPHYTIDYIFTNYLLRATRAQTWPPKSNLQTPISDHLGLRATLALQQQSSALHTGWPIG